jgi:hypothetical protein
VVSLLVVSEPGELGRSGADMTFDGITTFFVCLYAADIPPFFLRVLTSLFSFFI